MRRNTRCAILLAGLMVFFCAFGLGQATAETGRSHPIAILYTSDVHCAVSENIGYAGLSAYKERLLDEGYEVFLVDSGDAIQGAAIGSFSEGESIIELMNALGYTAMTLGNHEFDYGGPARVEELSKLAEFPFVCVNFRETKTGKSVYPGYCLVESDGVKIAFVGVSTPATLSSSTPIYFMDDQGEWAYDFLADGTGEALWSAVQNAVDEARAAGADYVFALTHLGVGAALSPYTSSELIAHTTGIDAVLDGHSHSVLASEQVKNKDGDWVLLSATGTKLENIGLLTIDPDGTLTTQLISDFEQRDAEVTALIEAIESEYAEKLNAVVAHLEAPLTIDDPATGARIIRNAETNLGDLCADAYRAAGDADIAFVNGGGIRASLPAGEITYGDVLAVQPYGNLLCKVEVTGQAVLDALEFGAYVVPEENGGFLQVSGLTYEIHPEIPSSVRVDENGMFVSVDGAYRVQNVRVAGEPLDLSRTYTLVSHNYMLKNFGDGYTMFEDCTMLMDEFLLDVDALTDYLNGAYAENADLYSDPYGEGRILAVYGD